MIKIILTGHGRFASGLTDSLNLIAGEQENFIAIEFTPDISPEELSARLAREIREAGEEGALILCDLAGGTPFNETVKLLPALETPVEVVAGVNLPALIEACTERDGQTPFSLAEQIQETGRLDLARLTLEDSGEEDFDE